MQARQEPWETSKYASINTQFAFRVGKARVTVAAGGAVEVRVGGKRPPSRPRAGRAAGRRLDRARAATGDRCSRPRATWPDGSRGLRLVRRRVGRRAAAAALGRARRGKLVGLLGNFDGNGANDFATRDGKQLDAAAVRGERAPRSSSCTASSAQSWRSRAGGVAAATTPGARRPATFTKRDFPSRFWTIDNLTAAASGRGPRRAAASSA